MSRRIITRNLARTATTVTGAWVDYPHTGDATINVFLDGAGTSAEVTIETRHTEDAPAYTAAEVSLSGASDAEPFNIENERWGQIRAVVTAVTGTVTVNMNAEG
jgi:hypothetical protein